MEEHVGRQSKQHEFGTMGWLYRNGEEDPTFVVQCATDVAPNGKQQLYLTLPVKVKSYKVGMHSRYLS